MCPVTVLPCFSMWLRIGSNLGLSSITKRPSLSRNSIPMFLPELDPDGPFGEGGIEQTNRGVGPTGFIPAGHGERGHEPESVRVQLLLDSDEFQLGRDRLAIHRDDDRLNLSVAAFSRNSGLSLRKWKCASIFSKSVKAGSGSALVPIRSAHSAADVRASKTLWQVRLMPRIVPEISGT